MGPFPILTGLLIAAVSAVAPSQAAGPPRLIVLTDISSLTAGVAEPDDGQSLVRLMLYANELEIEGLIATSTMGHGHTTRPDLIRQVVDAYGKVQLHLKNHDPRYPPATRLAGTIRSGQAVAGPRLPVEQSVGDGKDPFQNNVSKLTSPTELRSPFVLGATS
jgi:hypothetical protein